MKTGGKKINMEVKNKKSNVRNGKARSTTLPVINSSHAWVPQNTSRSIVGKAFISFISDSEFRNFPKKSTS